MRLSFRLLGSGYHSLSRVSSIIYRNSNNNFCLYEFCNFLLHFGGGGYILSTENNRIAVFGAGRNSPPAVISTHLIADVENVLDDVIFINKGRILLQQSVDQIRQEKGCSVDELFREVFRYAE